MDNNDNGYTRWKIEETERLKNVREYQKKFFNKIFKNKRGE